MAGGNGALAIWKHVVSLLRVSAAGGCAHDDVLGDKDPKTRGRRKLRASWEAWIGCTRGDIHEDTCRGYGAVMIQFK